MGRRRLALALLIPAPVRREVDGLRRAVGDPTRESIAPHVTLVPPVNVREDELAAGMAMLRSVAAWTEPLRFTLGPVATFHPVTPVLYLTVGGDANALGRLHELRQAVFQRPFERRVDHDFVPHVTLHPNLDDEGIAGGLRLLRHYRAPIRVDRLHVLEQREQGAGRPRWVPLADARFAAPAVVGRGGLEVELTVSALAPTEVAELDRSGATRAAAPRDPLVVTARRDDETLGAAGGWTSGPEAVLAWLAVEPVHRGLGTGRQLVAAFESTAAERGARRMSALVAPHEVDLLAFLAHLGWSRDPGGSRAEPADGTVRLDRTL